MTNMKLCADAGGTSIRLSYIDDLHNVVVKKKYPISSFPGGEVGILMALNQFVEEVAEVQTASEVRAIIVSVAGRVLQGKVQFTNTDWIISEDNIKQNFESTFNSDFQVKLINDFEALAYGLASIEDTDVKTISSREGFGDTKIVCGPGTGLGLAALKEYGDDLIVVPSEGGHQSFPVETSTEREIREYIMEDWVSYEHILSGQGLQLLFSYFSQKTNAQYIVEQSPEEIIQHYSAGNVAARKALEAFSYALGSFCGNMVLALGATKGVYLWGGILKSFPYEMLRNNMMRRFYQRGRAAGFVSDVPVYRITNDEIALKGSSIYCQLKME